MNASEYSTVRVTLHDDIKNDRLAAILRDLSLLIGQVQSAPVTLETGGTIVPGLGLNAVTTMLLNNEQFNQVIDAARRRIAWRKKTLLAERARVEKRQSEMAQQLHQLESAMSASPSLPAKRSRQAWALRGPQNQLSQLRAKYEQLLAQKQQSNAQAEQERQRLEAISELLTKLSNEANQLLMPDALSQPEERPSISPRESLPTPGMYWQKNNLSHAQRQFASRHPHQPKKHDEQVPSHPPTRHRKSASYGRGYESLKQISETVANALQDISVLIGQPQQRPVTLVTGGQIVPGLGLVNDAANLATRAKDMGQGVFKVMVLGEFKRGKSTLLNAILGQKILPAKATPATAIITVLVYGGGEEVMVYEAGQETPRNLSWQAFKSNFQLTK